MRQRLRQLIAETFELKESSLPDNPSPLNVSEWTSLGHLELVLRVEEEFTIHFETERIGRIISLDLMCLEIERVRQSSGP